MTAPEPAGQTPELPILDEVGAELSRIFHAPASVTQTARRSTRRRSARRPKLRVLVLVALLVLGATAAAVAASGVLSGLPSPPSTSSRPRAWACPSGRASGCSRFQCRTRPEGRRGGCAR